MTTALLAAIFGSQLAGRVVTPSVEAGLQVVLATLSPRESAVIISRFIEARSLSETAAMLMNLKTGAMGVTSERARQIETKALRKLRHPSRAVLLRSYMSTAETK